VKSACLLNENSPAHLKAIPSRSRQGQLPGAKVARVRGTKAGLSKGVRRKANSQGGKLKTTVAESLP